VRGAGLHSWLRANNRIYAWLKEPSLDAALVWNGYVAETSAFDLPAIRLNGVAAQSATLRLRCPDGWSIELDNTSLGAPTPPIAPRELAGQSSKPGQPVHFTLREPQAKASFRMLSVAAVADRQIDLTTFINPELRKDRPHSFVVSIQDAEGWETELQASGCRSLARNLSGDRKEWTIDVPRESESLALRLIARRPLASPQKLLLPKVVVLQGELPVRFDHQLALLGPELRDFEMRGLSRTDIASLAKWPDVSDRWRERGGSLWKFEAGDVRASVLAAPQPLGSNQEVQLTLTMIEAAPIGNRWSYRASVDLQHDAAASLTALLPAGCTFEGAALDGVEWTLPLGDVRASINLPAGRGVHLLHVAWSSAEPVWEPPAFESGGTTLNGGPILWTVCAPAGRRVDVDSSMGFASLHLRYAEALLRLAQEQEPGGIDDAAAIKLVIRAARRLALAEADLN
jgi:hypothetical protein